MITLILPYYRGPLMLQKQLETIKHYSRNIKVIIVDDCSPEPASSLITKVNFSGQLYRIDTDIPWNREGARNLGAYFADTQWIMHVDTDHTLPYECAEKLLRAPISPDQWYRFPRFRVGKADDTRKKDAIPEDQEYGSIKPHIDSYLCTKKLYWKAGGYNEDYSGSLGGGGPFLKRMIVVGGEAGLLPEDIYLQVWTRDKIPDASVWDLSRDKTEFKEKKKRLGIRKAKNPLRFKWHMVQ